MPLSITSLERIDAPESEPLTLEEARQHLRVEPFGSPESHPDDMLIEALITASREYVENLCNRSVMPQTWRLRMSEFDGPVRLRPPLMEVESFEVDGEAYTDYQVSSDDCRALLVPTDTWPSVCEVNAIEIVVRSGYGSGSPEVVEIPKSIKQAMLLLIGHWYENREAVENQNKPMTQVPLAVDALLSPYRAL